MNVTLVMFKSDGTRRDFNLHKDRTIVGRANTADLRIPLSSVSRQHCELWIEGGLLKVRDLGSSNGTFQNSVRVQEAILAPGDEIVIGPVVFTVVIDGLPKVVEPVRTILPEQEEGGGPRSRSGVFAASPAPRSAPVPDEVEEIEELVAADLEEVKAEELDEITEDEPQAQPLAELEDEQPKAAAAKSGKPAAVEDDDLLTLTDEDEPPAKPNAPTKPPASGGAAAAKPAPAAGKPAKENSAEIPTLEEDDPIAALAALTENEDDDEVIPLLSEDDEPKSKSPPPAPPKKK